MLIENTIVLLVVVGVGYVGLRLLSATITRVAAIRGLRHAPFIAATILIVGLLSLTMFWSWGGKGLLLGWTYLICFSISLYLANEVFRVVVGKTFAALSHKGASSHPKPIMLLSELIGWVIAALCFGVIGTGFATVAKMLGLVD